MQPVVLITQYLACDVFISSLSKFIAFSGVLLAPTSHTWNFRGLMIGASGEALTSGSAHLQHRDGKKILGVAQSLMMPRRIWSLFHFQRILTFATGGFGRFTECMTRLLTRRRYSS
jgi:hypothetical protein